MSDKEQRLCEGKITLTEAHRCLLTMSQGRTPGNDGLPVEFYTAFWKIIGPFVIDSINYGYDHGQLSTSQRQSIITLIEKKGKDKQFVKNWRPISLINVDSKIGSRCIAKRMEAVVPKLIYNTQSASVKGRDIGDVVRLIEEILLTTDEKRIPGILIAIDFEKAFDSLEWDFLFDCLKAFNFGPSFIQWVKSYYSDVESTVINNGYTTGYFKVERGVRQGDPLSPSLFILALEVFLISMRSNQNIHGIKIGDKTITDAAFADDLSCFLNDEESVTSLFNLLQWFHNVSGLKVNTSKTEALRLGSWKNRKDKPFGIKWPAEPIKIVGIHFSYDKKWATTLNFAKPMENFERTLNMWKQRNLTIIGKIQIVKSLALSKLIYLIRITSVPANILIQVNRKMFNFIWSGHDRVARKVMISGIDAGGLMAPDIYSMLNTFRVMWLKRYLDNSDNYIWKKLFLTRLKPVGGNLVFSCNYDPDLLKICSPDFYLEALKSWSDTKGFDSKNQISKRIIWNNKGI